MLEYALTTHCYAFDGCETDAFLDGVKSLHNHSKSLFNVPVNIVSLLK
jgi:hypothetical protein